MTLSVSPGLAHAERTPTARQTKKLADLKRLIRRNLRRENIPCTIVETRVGKDSPKWSGVRVEVKTDEDNDQAHMAIRNALRRTKPGSGSQTVGMLTHDFIMERISSGRLRGLFVSVATGKAGQEAPSQYVLQPLEGN